MTPDLQAEHQYWYDERLALLEFYGDSPAWAHNMALLQADQHVAQLQRQDKADPLALDIPLP